MRGVILSTTGPEYTALSEVVKELKYSTPAKNENSS